MPRNKEIFGIFPRLVRRLAEGGAETKSGGGTVFLPPPLPLLGQEGIKSKIPDFCPAFCLQLTTYYFLLPGRACPHSKSH